MHKVGTWKMGNMNLEKPKMVKMEIKRTKMNALII